MMSDGSESGDDPGKLVILAVECERSRVDVGVP